MTYYAAACCCEESVGCVDPQTGEFPTCLDFGQELYIVVEGTAFWSYDGTVEQKTYGTPICNECIEVEGCLEIPNEAITQTEDRWTQTYRRTGSVRFKALMQVGQGGSAALVNSPSYPPDLRVSASGYQRLENEYESSTTRCFDGQVLFSSNRNNYYESEYPQNEEPEIVDFDLRRTVVYKTCDPPGPQSIYEQITYCESEYLQEGCYEKWTIDLSLRLHDSTWKASIDEVSSVTGSRGGVCDLVCSEVEDACPLHSNRCVSYGRIPFGESICPQNFRRPVNATENRHLNWVRPPYWLPGEINECDAINMGLCRGEDVHWFPLDPSAPHHYFEVGFYTPSAFVVTEYCGDEIQPTGGWKPLYHWSGDCRGVVSGESGQDRANYGEENIFVCLEQPGSCMRCGFTGQLPPNECKTCRTGLDRSMDIDCNERFLFSIPRHDLLTSLPNPTDWPTNV